EKSPTAAERQRRKVKGSICLLMQPLAGSEQVHHVPRNDHRLDRCASIPLRNCAVLAEDTQLVFESIDLVEGRSRRRHEPRILTGKRDLAAARHGMTMATNPI